MVKGSKQSSGDAVPLFGAYRRASCTPTHRNHSMIHAHKMIIMDLILHFFYILINYCYS